MGELAKNDYWFYLRAVLGYNFLDPWDHGEELVHFLESNLGHPMMFIVPRGGAKTGTITVPFLPWAIAKDPTLRGLIANVREPKAKNFARQAASIITTPRYQACFPYVMPSSKWGEEGYYTQQAAMEDLDDKDRELEGSAGRVDASIGSVGVTGNITGAHVRALLLDDLINDETYMSEIENSRAVRFIKESFNCLDPGGQILMQFTRWAPGDCYSGFEEGKMPGPGEKFRVFKRGAERTVLDDAGNPVTEIFNPHRTYVDMHGKTQQVGYTKAYLESMKEVHGELYYAIYMNQPISDANRRLQSELVKEFIRLDFDFAATVRVGVEAGGVQDAFYNSLTRRMREEEKSFSLERLIPPRRGEKAKHIESALGRLTREGRLYVREDSWIRPNGLKKEMDEFPLGSEDDLLDAVRWLANKAPRYQAGALPIPYVAVDPAYTIGPDSNSTALAVGFYYGEEQSLYVLETMKFKANKSEAIENAIFRWVEKYSRGGKDREAAKLRRAGFHSPGNEPPKTQRPTRRATTMWGHGIYAAHYLLKGEHEEEHKNSGANPFAKS